MSTQPQKTPAAKLVLTLPDGQEQTFSLEKEALTLGRATHNDIVLADGRASRVHARLECADGLFTLVDLGSTNRTLVNYNPIEKVTLSAGDLIAIGGSLLRFEQELPAIDESEMTQLNTVAELEATLRHSPLQMNLRDSSLPRLTVHAPDRTWELPFAGNEVAIGRSGENDLVLDYSGISRRHARLERRGGLFMLRDLGSFNGTLVNGRPIDEYPLEGRETIQMGPIRLLFKPPFNNQDLTSVDVSMTFAHQKRRPVVFVPGLMGSELWLGAEQIWPNPRQLFTQAEILRLPDKAPIEPRGIVREIVIVPNLVRQEQYNRLGDYLEEGLGYQRGVDLLEFAYDWRQDIRDSARRLAQAIDAWEITPPIILLAHSLGTLVSRYYVERLGGKNKVERLILMGGPHRGAPKAITTLVSGPDLLPFGLLGERLRQVLNTFPSMYQILPTYACAADQATGRKINLFEDDSWLAEEQRPLMKLARDFRRELGSRTSVPTVSIFGYGLKTVTGISVNLDAKGRWSRFDVTTANEGDATVPEQSAILPKSEIHPVEQNHGALYVDNDVKMRLKLELTR